MKKETYVNMMTFICQRKNLRRFMIVADKVLTLLVYAFYPAFILWLLVSGHEGMMRAVLVPGISFVLLSAFRNIYNRPRPYEVFNYPSAIPKDTKGKSFPSRHVFSCFVIGFTAMFYLPAAGFAIIIAGTVLAAVRVTGGIHFTKDVLAGLAFAIIAVIVGFYVA